MDALDGAVRRPSAEAFASPLPVDESRKRPYSNISGDGFPTPTSNSGQAAAWAPDQRPIRPYMPPDQPWSANDLAPRPMLPTELGADSSLPARPEASVLDGMPDGLPQDPLHPIEQVGEIEDIVFSK